MADTTARLNVLIAYKASMAEADRALEWLKKFTLGLTTASVAMGTMAAKSAIALGSQLTDLASQAQMSTDAFQNLALEAEKNGVAYQQTADSAAQLRKNVQDAAAGNKGMVAALAALNLTAAGLQQLAPERQWEVIGQRIAAATDRQAALNAATKLFGDTNGPKLLSTLQRLGVDGYDKVASSLNGIRLNKDQLKTLDDAGNKLQRIMDYVKFMAAHKLVEAIDSPMAQIIANTAKLTAGNLTIDERLKVAQDNLRLWRQQQNDVMSKRWEAEVADLEASIAQRNDNPAYEQQQRLAHDAQKQRQESVDTTLSDAGLAAWEKAFRATRVKIQQQDYQLLEGIRQKMVEIGKADEAASNKWALTEELNKANVELTAIGDQLARIDADPFLTDVAKRRARVDLLTKENGLIDDQVGALKKLQYLPGVDPVGVEKTISDKGRQQNQNTFTIGQSRELDYAEQRMASIVALQNELGTDAAALGRAYTGTVHSAIDSIAQGIQGLIDGTLTWGDALKAIGGGILNGLIQSISRMFAEWIVGRALAAVKNIAASEAEGAADAAAKAPGAALTSISTAGYAAVAGMAAFVAAMALFGGFAGGGYTGDGARNEIAGAVHRGEVVLEQPIVRGQEREVMGIRAALQAGVPAATLLGRAGYASGGMVGGSVAPAAAGARPGGGGDVFNFSYSFAGGVSRQEVLGLIPKIVEASKAGVLEAQKRKRGGF